MAVLVPPGLSALTRTRPALSSSSASVCDSPSVANFDTAYAPQYARPTRPTPEDVKTMDASGAASSSGSSARVSSTGAMAFTCMTSAHASAG